MENKISVSMVHEFYDLVKAYWNSTVDEALDSVPKKTRLAKAIDSNRWIEVTSLMDFVVKQNHTVYAFLAIMELLGYKFDE